MGCYEYNIMYQSGKDNISADTFKSDWGTAINNKKLSDLHVCLCHPGITLLAHFVRIIKLSYSIKDVKRVLLSILVNL